MNPLTQDSAWQKIGDLRLNAQTLLTSPQSFNVPEAPGRDVKVVRADELPPKKGLSDKAGQARLVHDLASIELQAMELGIRTLIEFPEAPALFRAQLLEITLQEAMHFQKCLECLELLDSKWGSVPVHIALWNSVDPSDSLLDRVLIVHRYLEGSGLDAGDTLLRRLYGISEGPIHAVAKLIVKEEIAHVDFGSVWFRNLCKIDGLNEQDDFATRMEKIRYRVPKRMEPISRPLRKAAGFSDFEIEFLENLRLKMVKKEKQIFPEHVWNQQHLKDFVQI
jgi:uncharacterized ferritin-like protein (DUF455 family)